MTDVREIIIQALAANAHLSFTPARADAILSALDAAGLVIVPREMTDEMEQAFYDGEWMTQKPRPNGIWSDMVAAAIRPIEEVTDNE